MMIAKPLIAYYGDDFSGSADVMESLARCGVRTVLFVGTPSPDQLERFRDVQAIGIAGTARAMSPEDMDAELPAVFAALKKFGALVVHFKVCSTFDSSSEIGSIGHGIDIAQKILHSPFVPLVVGAPRLARYTVFGNLFARSGLDSDVFRLDRHPTMQFHPTTPMNESDLRVHLGKQTSKSIGLFDILQMTVWKDEVEERFARLLASSPEIVLFDILTDEQLPIIGKLLAEYASAEQPLFAVGSSGVEYALTQHWTRAGVISGTASFEPGPPVERLLVVSGSASPVNNNQIAYALERGFEEVALQPEQFVNPATVETALHQAAERTLDVLARGHSVIVHTARGPQDKRIDAVMHAFAEQGHNAAYARKLTARVLGSAMGSVVKTIARETALERVCTAGGDTASYITRSMGVEALEVQHLFQPAMPFCRVHARDHALDGVQMIFKGGQTGKVDFFCAVRQGTMA